MRLLQESDRLRTSLDVLKESVFSIDEQQVTNRRKKPALVFDLFHSFVSVVPPASYGHISHVKSLTFPSIKPLLIASI